MDDVKRSLDSSYAETLKPSKLAHVVIRTPCYNESREWWAKVLNAHPAYENEQLCFMTYDDEHHRIGIINVPDLGGQAPSNAGMEHVSFAYNTLGDLLATYLRLKEAGIVPFWCINHGPTISMYFRDPDQNKVELQYDVFPTPVEVDAFFASGKYEENFMGIIFDPDEMCARYMAGVSLEELVHRPPLPEGMGPWDMHRP
ncbi:VOC family protein [Kordiimonas pumila]|uniref:VOC family protein n=1 Tax=Kordiimonas pumila TaxID=2161677 RepID=A0ABV7D5G5_9PROT|nr:VOC family protein [Kordiimonas pumila]